MPPRGSRAGSDTGNRIGVGVGYDDPGDSTLAYLRNVDAAAKNLIATFRELGTIRVDAPQFKGGAGSGSIQQQVGITPAQAQETKRRITDVTNHQIAEGRRASDVMQQLARKSVEELKRDALTYSQAGYAEHANLITKEIQRRAGGGILGQNLSAEERALLEAAKNPDPNRYYSGKHLGWPQYKEGAGPTPETPPAARRGRKVHPPIIDAQTGDDDVDPVIRKEITKAQRRDLLRQWRLEQQMSSPVGALRGDIGPGQGEIDLEWEKRERRRKLNEAINERGRREEQRELDREAQTRGYRSHSDERAHAAEMARRVREAEAAADRRYGAPGTGGITPVAGGQVSSAMAEAGRRHREEMAAKERAKREQEAAWTRQVEIDDTQREANRAQENAKREADRVRRDEEARLVNQAADRRRGLEDAANRVARRDEGRGYEERVRAGLPTTGPEAPAEVKMRNAEEAKKAQRDLRSEVRQTLETYDEWAAKAIADLDRIENQTTNLATATARQQQAYQRGGMPDAARSINTHVRGQQQLAAAAAALRHELEQPPNMRRPEEVIRASMEAIQREFQETIRENRQMKREIGNNPPPNPWDKSIYARGVFGMGGHGGFGSAVGTMVMYGGLYRGIAAMKDLAATSIENARAQSMAENTLAAATQQAGKLAFENERIVMSLQAQAGASRTVALQATAAATRFATSAGMPGKEGELARIISNIGVAKGVAAEGIPELVESAMKEKGRFSQEYLGKTQEQLYREYAMRHRPELEQEYTSRGLPRRTLNETISSLTDMEKRRAIIEEIERRQGEFANAQMRREGTLAGQMERAASAWNNMTASIGRFIMTSRPLIDLMEGVANLLGGASGGGANTPGSGPGGMLTERDIQRIRAESVTGAGSTTQASAGFLTRLVGQASGVGIGKNLYDFTQSGDWRDLLRAVPVIGAGYGAMVDQRTSDEAYQNKQADLARMRQHGEFLELQKQGRIIYRDAGGKEYRQAELDKLNPQQRATVMSNFNLGRGQGYRVEADAELDARMQREFNKQLAEYRKVQFAEDQLRKTEGLVEPAQARYAQLGAFGNDFTKPLMDMDSAIERVRKTWGGFSQEVQDGFVQMEKGAALFDYMKTRFDTQISAARSLAEARRLETQAVLETTAADERRINVLNAQLKAAQQIPRLYAEMKELTQQRPLSEWEQENVGRDSLQRIRNLLPVGFDEKGNLRPRPGQREAERAYDTALRGFTDQYPIEFIREGRSPLARELRSERLKLNQREINRLWEDVDLEMGRARVGGQAAEEAQKLVNRMPELRRIALREGVRQGLTGDQLRGYADRINAETRGDILAITSQLGERELTPQLRQARITALKEDAASKLRAETTAQTTRTQTMKFIAQILAEIQAYKKTVGQSVGAPEGYTLGVTVDNQTTASITGENLKPMPTGMTGQGNNKGGNPYQTTDRTKPGFRTGGVGEISGWPQ